MFYKISSTFLLFLLLSADVHSKATLTANVSDRQLFGLDGACEDQLLKYRKFMLQVLINTPDVCNTFELISNVEMNELPNTNEQHAELANFLRAFVQRLPDREINSAIEEAVLDKCNQKTQLIQHTQQQAQMLQQQQQQHQMKREYVVLGKKQRFHSWGGKRAENLHNEPASASLYYI